MEVEDEMPTQVLSDDAGAFAESHDVCDDVGMGGGEWDDGDTETAMAVSPFKPSHPVDHPTQVRPTHPNWARSSRLYSAVRRGRLKQHVSPFYLCICSVTCNVSILSLHRG